MGGPDEEGWHRVGFKQVFSGGGGIIYAVTPVVETSAHLTGGTALRPAAT